ncbi:hypothetical protein LIA77_08820 [Sarocladium implicatum]|nr:hypothetical protein LIA77_08820 [Sarocladium implicatum]
MNGTNPWTTCISQAGEPYSGRTTAMNSSGSKVRVTLIRQRITRSPLSAMLVSHPLTTFDQSAASRTNDDREQRASKELRLGFKDALLHPEGGHFQ